MQSEVKEISQLAPSGYIRQSQLIPHILPISPATLWRWVKAGKFPASIKLSPHVTVWKVEEVRAWLETLNSKTAA